MSKEYDQREYLLDDLYEARALWERGEYLIAPHSAGMIAVDKALDALVEYDKRVADFERVFNPDYKEQKNGQD